MIHGSLTIDHVRRILAYNRTTGHLTWKTHRGGKAVAGARAGSIDGEGRRQISLCGRVFREHRVIWFHVTGRWPKDEIDHKNGNTSENRWRNLREATSTINKENRRAPNKNNQIAVLGVGKGGSKYRARIMVNRREINLGRFSTKEAAHDAYVKAKRAMHAGGLL